MYRLKYSLLKGTLFITIFDGVNPNYIRFQQHLHVSGLARLAILTFLQELLKPVPKQIYLHDLENGNIVSS